MGFVLRLASRKSPLALQQTRAVAERLTQQLACRVDIIAISTRGDDITDRPLAEVGGKALFIKGLQDAIRNGSADAAVHSLKDMEAQPTAGFTLAAVGFAADYRDAVIHPEQHTLAELPPQSVVGTCSPRRAALLRHYYPSLTVKPIRGNLQTRLARLKQGDYDALLLAAAGLARLGLSSLGQPLAAEQFIPAAGQGLLGIECAEDNHSLIRLLTNIGDAAAARRARAERAFAAAMEGDCHTALGALATPAAETTSGTITLHAFYAGNATQSGFYQTTVTAADGETAGKQAATDIRQQYAAD